ncbi:flagellar hook-basal body complex protein FliE [Glaciimonas soli]|uniref:Flagellar hook-basal body complex protein FliE n=1 Tax=Glaciimonas soli TaxID=2590999 RepID=A0A843YI51_9BURK|nr:flagellar hook-basal body complex protein FliE [Glaciimonas soli]MQQ99438.1 flagellar hook-basal body complex protein FliE [Glaciimonas soli]
MSISSIQTVLQQLQATAQAASGSSDNTHAGAIGSSFSDEMKKTLERISSAQTSAQSKAQDFELGKPGVALNDVMVDLQKANIGFQMGLQVRNKVVSAYQEIMNLPA